MSIYLQEIARHIWANESCIHHMYADSNGNVTVGVGQLLDTVEKAQKLPFVHRERGHIAHNEDIAQAWQCIKNFGNPEGAFSAHFYKDMTDLVLSDDDCRRHFYKSLESFIKEAKAAFPQFIHFPKYAQVAVCDIFYNRGSGRAREMLQCLKDENWLQAAKICHDFAHSLYAKGLKSRYQENARMFENVHEKNKKLETADLQGL